MPKKHKQLTAIIIVLLVAVVGTLLILGSRAVNSSLFVSINSSNGTLSGNATKQSCTVTSTGSCVFFAGSTGTSKFIPGTCGSGGCTASSVHGFNIIVPDASYTPYSSASGGPTSCTAVGPGCVTRNFQIYRPNNLLTNPAPPLLISFAGSIGTNAQWYASAIAKGYVVVLIFNVHNTGTPTNLQYAFPTTNFRPLTPEQNCGVNGTSDCDDIPQVVAVLNALNCPYVSGGSTSLCQGYNTKEVFTEGGSKGGGATTAVACDTRTSSRIAGISDISNNLGSVGASSATPPNCPAMFPPTSSCFNDCISVAPNKNISLQFISGSADPGVSSTSCTVSAANDCIGNGFLNNAGLWTFGTKQMASLLFGSAFGCSQTPATTTTGLTGKIATRTYSNCTNANVAMQSIDVYNGLHMPDTWPCNSPTGSVCASGTDYSQADGLSEPLAAWSFWTKYYP
ncbi:MAG TPA: hypothetical protein VLF63_03460 [Patescibacteria group bacterium]|nr:hypothetical protein [Patescibacteria group bacterium]